MITCNSQELGDRYHELLNFLAQSMTYTLCSGRSGSWHNLRIYVQSLGEGGFGMKCMSEKMCRWDCIFAIAYV